VELWVEVGTINTILVSILFCIFHYSLFNLNTIGQLPQISGNIDTATQVRTAI
jgi:hypothetical protein